MLPTPDYADLREFKNVYEPCEDTFLLLDALEEDLDMLSKLEPSVAVEIGCGSGVVINFLAKYLKKCTFLATDINKQACEATRVTSAINSNHIDVVNCDLIMPMLEKLHKNIDILIFNPPYVVTDSNELNSTSIQAAWAGGKDGRVVMDRLFPLLDRILSPSGVFYLVCIQPNRIDDVELVLNNFGFKLAKVLNRKAGIENLFILRFTRK